MEIKLSVSIGATLQVKNAKGEWDWIKPEVGCEISVDPQEFSAVTAGEDPDITPRLQDVFSNMWDNVVGPQFASVVNELISDQTPKVEETTENVSDVMTEEVKVSEESVEDSYVSDEDDYY